MRGKALIGWVVDVQHDFVDPDGRLYVRDPGDDDDPGAVAALPVIEKAVEWMRTHCDIIVFTGDWHAPDDEIHPENADPARVTYPPHCLGQSDDPMERQGAEFIESVRPANPVVLEPTATAVEARAGTRLAVEESRAIHIQKSRFDVFEGNPSAEHVVGTLELVLDRDLEIYVAGVARDISVTAAVVGLAERGYEVVALKDATWGFGTEAEDTTLARWAHSGRVVSTEDLPP